jgi:predicted Zn-dependent peptidase
MVRETRLDNGLVIVTEAMTNVYGVALGLRVDVGTRDEADEQAGISHVLEHMLFKGTERRTAREIAEEFDAVGGNLDAFTSKEYTGYSARVLPEHVPLALDVLADMLRHSLIDTDELELEKGVILEEFKSLEDAAEEYVHDIFGRTLWPTHPLGRPVIGTPEVIAGLEREDVLQFHARHYVPDRMICAAAGNLEHDAFVSEVARHLGELSGTSVPRKLTPPDPVLEECLVHRPTEQAHFCMGVAAVDENDPDRWALRVLNLVLGGGMSSRLFQEIREKRGLCYSIGSEATTYREGGMFVVYADTSPQQLEEVRDLTRQELLSAAKNGLTAEELERAKQQVRAALLLSLDDAAARMNRLARSLLYHGRVLSTDELMGFVDAVTLEACQRVAERVFGSGEFAFAAIGPFGKRRRRRMS